MDRLQSLSIIFKTLNNIINMKSTNLLKSIAAVFAGIAMFSCTETPGGDDPNKKPDENLNMDIAFTLELDEVTENSAKVKVSHDGERTDTWYGFVTTETNLDAAILAEVEDLLQEDGTIKSTDLKKSTGTNVNLRNLEENTDYTYVVFGLSDKGTVYGTPESIEFTTKKAFTGLTESDDWTLAYNGRKDGKEIFSVECDENSIYMFDIIDEYYVTDEDGTSYLYDYMLMLVEQFQSLFDAGYTVEDCLEAGYLQQGPGELATDRMASGNYYMFAIGYNADGTPVETYSSEAFTIEQEEATEEYLQWAGTYKLEDANGVYFDIEIVPIDNNYMYAVLGWETGEYFNQDLDGDKKPDGIDFNGAFGDDYTPAFPVYFNDGKIELYEYVITPLEMTEDQIADFGIYAWGTYQGESTVLYTGGALIATGTTEDNGATGTLTGGSVESTAGDVIEIDAISYAAVSETSYWWFNDPIEFPISLTKKAEDISQQSMKPASALTLKKKFNEEKKVITASPKRSHRVF